jgi:hypothetical protein
MLNGEECVEQSPRFWHNRAHQHSAGANLMSAVFVFGKNYQCKLVVKMFLAQLRVMAGYGGCGVLPSGVYH